MLPYLIGFFIASFILIVIFSITDNIDKKNKISEYAAQGYNFEDKLELGYCTLAIDPAMKKLLIMKPHSRTSIYEEREYLLGFEEIIGFEINKNGETITKASLGAPIMGGILLGAGGVVLGSILGNRKSKATSKVDIIIQLNSFKNPIIKLTAYNLDTVEKLCVWLKLILEENENIKNLQEV